MDPRAKKFVWVGFAFLLTAIAVWIVFFQSQKLYIYVEGLSLIDGDPGKPGATIYFPIMNDPNGYSTPHGSVPTHHLVVDAHQGNSPPFTVGAGPIIISLSSNDPLQDPEPAFYQYTHPMAHFTQGGTTVGGCPACAALHLPAGRIKVRNQPGDVCDVEYRSQGQVLKGKAAFVATVILNLPSNKQVYISYVDEMGLPQSRDLDFSSGGYILFQNGPPPSPAGTPTPTPDLTTRVNPHFDLYYRIVTPPPNQTPTELWMGDCSPYKHPGIRCVPVMKF